MVRRDDQGQSEIYNGIVAVPSKKGKNQSLQERSPLQLAAIRLFAAGKSRPVVAKVMAPYLFPREWARDEAMAKRAARKKLREWEETQWFRDAVYETSLMQLDADLPTILKGMSRRARRRVDAARLVLEVTGRHNPRGEQQAPAVVQINFAGQIPRPANRPQIEDGTVVDGEVTEEEDDAI